jgi:hypothetical protein
MIDYTKFKLDKDDIIIEAIERCRKEMYARAQPPINYDDVVKEYKEDQAAGKEITRVYTRHYLSQQEFIYILNKYIKAYHLEEVFKEHCNIIIEDMQNGCNKTKYIPANYDEYGNYYPGYRDYEPVPPLKEIIGEEAANKVIEFIKNRQDFYRFDRDESCFRISVSLSDSPTSNPEDVIEYWKSQGVDLNIDPRKLSEDEFWDEEHGYTEEE